ncbi:relaxase/mobilization nuclease domain-containing protein [Ottowia thiooxydans]|uniref:relaxase/mobilization nuclease domain-containing protein n=1 Tax=Ottowia thiooxydans TaxID=219182 RepID=UPI003CCC4623
MDKFRRTVFRVQPTPKQWYVKTLISFDPRATQLLAQPSDHLEIPRKNGSIHKNALRIAHDVLDALGCAEDHVGIFVVHTDRPHVHVHGLVVLAQAGGRCWNPFELTKPHLRQVSEVATEVFGHPAVEIDLIARRADL